MDFPTMVQTLSFYLAQYYPDLLDPTLRVQDSSGCQPCKNTEYDFIIAGAGSAGCVLASRLSENPSWKVLLIESGGSEDYITDVPRFTDNLERTKYSWNFTSVRQTKNCLARGGICRYQYGHVMGGSSAVNGLVFNRGNHEDYDHWEKLGNPGWGYNDILNYFLKLENMTDLILAKSPYHSVGGPIDIGHAPFRPILYQDFLKSGIEYGLNITDYNGAEQSGVAYVQQNLKKPVRCSTAKAYLDPIRDRENLVIFQNTNVTKILFNNENPRRAIGVSCVTNGERYNMYARKEVILSTGAINTPKLLMLSGIGPKDHLEELGIPVYADLPVGKKLMDHTRIAFKINVSMMEADLFQITNITLLEFAKDKGGLLTSVIPVLANLKRNKSETTPPIMIYWLIPQSKNFIRLEMAAFLLDVKSQGSIKLASRDFMEQPLIDPNYYNSLEDLDNMLWGIRQIFKIIKSPSLAKYSPELSDDILPPQCKVCKKLSEDFIKCIIYYSGDGANHLVGTASIGIEQDNCSVVNSSLQVHKVKGLRVVDASVMPYLVRGNLNAPVIMIAEKASEMIKNLYGA